MRVLSYLKNSDEWNTLMYRIYNISARVLCHIQSIPLQKVIRKWVIRNLLYKDKDYV